MQDHGKALPDGFTVKTAGWSYFIIIATSLLALVLLNGRFTVTGDSGATVMKMAEHSLSVRMSLLYEVLMFSGVILLSASLYSILKPINELLARTALLLRIGEAILGYLGVACSLAVLAVLESSGGNPNVVMQAVQLYELREACCLVLMACISLGTIINFALFHRSRFIPRFLSVWGMAGFSLMLAASVFRFLDLEDGPLLNAIAAVAAISFEIVIGLWLIVRGAGPGARR